MTDNNDSKKQLATRLNWISAALAYVVGIAILVGIGFGLYKVSKEAYHWLFAAPSASLALSAYFEEAPDKPPALRISGEVQQSGKLVNEGKVKLTIQKLKSDFRQSILLDLSQGRFEALDNPSFRAVKRDDPVQVDAQVWSTQLPDGPLTERLCLNARAPLLSRTAVYSLLLGSYLSLLFVFLYAFTGKRSPFKNRLAIIFSYLVTFIFLTLPLIAPVSLLHAFPDLRDAMKETAVGLIVSKLDDRPDSKPQWALNIGGRTQRADPTNPDLVKVEGGLVIPLYVIILAAIGGAINMTRQVPRFQKEGEVAETTIMSTAYRAFTSFFGGHRSAPKTAEAEGLPSDSGQPCPPPQEEEASRTRARDWRTELLNQYMFLISAPFLAIATYYMLVWLDLTKTPILVLVSFSVGLISEPILRAITDLAYSFIRRQPPSDAHEGGSKATGGKNAT